MADRQLIRSDDDREEGTTGAETIILRLPENYLLTRIDEFRRSQVDIPRRSAAIRRLLDIGLRAALTPRVPAVMYYAQSKGEVLAACDHLLDVVQALRDRADAEPGRTILLTMISGTLHAAAYTDGMAEPPPAGHPAARPIDEEEPDEDGTADDAAPASDAITCEQLWNARYLLGWGYSDIARLSGVSYPTVKALTEPRYQEEALAAIVTALKRAGIRFAGENVELPEGERLDVPTGRQVAEARKLLGISVEDLAEKIKSGRDICAYSIRDYEGGKECRDSVGLAIRFTLEDAGAVFGPNDSVSLSTSQAEG
ncbi:hypothetical protein [Roseospira navarrensis]|uniref:Uncharacterized protein n=1 Tax=Roseospira navarrensis TaxID=140058 RepID=A0A7X1ZHF5_9PROT|nr:hypothetical protein [Roseospira navarrensis]MQX38564.1 hypothetical protein [Roseospira navarrensis]